jgi:CBS domain-containing protein
VRVHEVMTESVVTAAPDASVQEIAELMRERNVGSVVLVEGGKPVGFLTDRDLAVSVLAAGRAGSDPAREFASSPVLTAEPELTIQDAGELMVRHGVRRLVVMAGDDLVGVVALDDLASSGLVSELSARVTRAALPDFYFHARGG